MKKVRIFRAWFSHGSGAVSALEPLERKAFSRLRSEKTCFETLFFSELKEGDVVEAPADRLVGPGGLCGTIQEDSWQELAFVVMQKISTVAISMEVQLKE